NLRRKHGITVLAVYRNKQMYSNPEGTYVLEAGDVIYVLGSSRDISRLTQLASADSQG
ncbi:TrkA family potassium uptake protein, partial [candidate division GN15 bacterium]|nr:TrkA family potassium uptake protein [candidate division GN15 bacterium]